MIWLGVHSRRAPPVVSSDRSIMPSTSSTELECANRSTAVTRAPRLSSARATSIQADSESRINSRCVRAIGRGERSPSSATGARSVSSICPVTDCRHKLTLDFIARTSECWSGSSRMT